VKPDRASRTAQAIAAVRAAETFRPADERLFEDRFARGFLGPRFRLLVDLSRIPAFRRLLVALYDRRLPGAMVSAVCRTRFIDDALGEALADGAQQVLILGAGFDSRAYRISGMEGVSVFEVDHPATQALKRAGLARMLPAPPPHVRFVPIDFTRENLKEALGAAGYRSDLQSFFIWEGVTGYLTAEAVEETLRFVSSSASPGSRIVFSYIHQGVIDGTAQFEGAREVSKYVRRFNEPFTFGLDPEKIAAYLAERGFELVEELGGAEYRARYPTITRTYGTRISEFSRVALASVIVSGGSEGSLQVPKVSAR
jgi:methyltransferase (TIGR00027 family)